MSRLLLTAAVLAILVYAMVLGVRWLTPRIEQDIADRVTTSLAEQGLLWADVTVKGRQVTLSGEAPSADSHDKAVAAASKVFGVAKVDDQLMVAGDASATNVAKAKGKKGTAPYVLSITKDGENVVISGQVSSEADKAVLQRLATTHYGEGHVNVDGIKVVEGAPAGWRTAAGTVLFNIFNMEKAVATLSDTEVMVSGNVVDQQFSDQMEQAVKATLPESYKVAFAVDVVTPSVADIQPAAGEPASSATCANVEEVKKERLRFDFDKAQLKTEHTAILKRVADKLEGCSNQHVVLAGFTDQTGSPLYNKWLSQQRAEAALRGLMRDGVAKDRLQAVGYGEKHPEVSNDTREGRAQNRRVEFHPGDKLPFAETAAVVPASVKKAAVKAKVAEKKIVKPWWAEKGAAAPANEVKHEVPMVAPKAKTDEAGLVN